MASQLPEYDPKFRIIQFVGAENPACWPKAASDEICIFEAVDTVGKALSGDEWTGEEFGSIVWVASPKLEAALKNKLAPINTGGGALGSARRSQPSRTSFASFPRAPNAHVLAWYLELRDQHWERNNQRVKRLTAAVEQVAQWCRDGQLQSFARLRSGGPLWPMTSSEWNLDNPLKTFVSEGGNRRYFSNFTRTGPFECFVFFKKSRLSVLAGTLSHSSGAIEQADISKLSPYLQLAIKVALANHYFSASDCETQPVREAEIEQAWGLFMPEVPTSKTAISAIAKVMAYPNATAIEQGKAGPRKKGGRTPVA